MAETIRTKNNINNDSTQAKIDRLAAEYYHMQELKESIEKIINNTATELKRLIFGENLSEFNFSSVTHNTDQYEINLNHVRDYEITRAGITQIVNTVPRDLAPIRYEAKLDEKQLRYLELNEPEIYKTCHKAFSVAETVTVQSIIKKG